MKNKKILQAFICAGIATILALTTHIYISEWMNTILAAMTQGVDMNPDASTYSPIIICTAYGTAFITIGLLVFLYYHTQHLIPGKSNLIKTLFLTGIIVAIKGEPIRQPIMNIVLNYEIGLQNPFLFVALQQIDKWLALFLLAVCLVYLCPKKNKACLVICLIFFTNLSYASEEIIPYKFTDTEEKVPVYDIPSSSRFTIKRPSVNAPDIIYYFSKPNVNKYPIAILCGGSSSKESVGSIIDFHRYFLQEFQELGTGVLTVEQWGVDGYKVNIEEFMEHYTRSERLHDHQAVIEHLKSYPPKGWNGKLIFLGVSEGGLIVTTLTTEYSNITLATINWSGAGEWLWREELWTFLQKLLMDNPNCKICSENITSRVDYDLEMDKILQNRTSDKYFLGMTYKYHADALNYPKFNYQKISTPFLVVAGELDTIIKSSDEFVKKAKEAGVKITYISIPDMDHYVRKRPDIIKKSFEWLRQQLN